MNKKQFDKLAMDIAMFVAGDNAQKQSNLKFWGATFENMVSETQNPKAKCEICKKHNSSWVFDWDMYKQECCNGCALEQVLEHMVAMQNKRQP